MRKKIVSIYATLFLFGVLLGLAISFLTGCNASESAKYYGGSKDIYLEAGQKLELITWKEDSLWVLTRAMYEDDIAETHVYKEYSPYSIIEGTVYIYEEVKE